MKVSIIFPVYNVAKYVEDSIISVLNQNYEDMEILVIDDCGTDNSIKIIKRIIATHRNGSKVKIIRQRQNSGLSEARNRGIREAKGDWITFVDSDDLLVSGAISALATKALSGKYDMIVANRNIVEFGTNALLHNPSSRKTYEIEMHNIDDYSKFGLQGEAYNKFISRKFLIDNNLFFEPGILFEDTLWASQLKCFLPKVLYIPNVVYIYRIRQGSIMTTYNAKHILSRLKVCLAFSSFIQANKFESEIDIYAIDILEQFRCSALWDIFSKTENGVSNYMLACNLMKAKSRIDIRPYMKSEAKFLRKIRALTFRFPYIGNWLNLPILIIQHRKDLKKIDNRKKILFVDQLLDLKAKHGK